MQYTTTATLTYGNDGDREFALTVEYEYHPAYRGAREGRYGVQLEPDEPAHVTISSVTGRLIGFCTKTAKHIEIGDEIDFEPLVNTEILADEILADHEGRVQEAREQAAEMRRDAIREGV
jgi:hypothetical protein